MSRHKKDKEQTLIRWRRKEVAERWLGDDEDAKSIAEKLKVSVSLIYEDMDYIEEHADDFMRVYISKTVPAIISKSIYQISMANKACRHIVKHTDNEKLKITAALAVARTARDVVEIIAGNKGIVEKALELDETLKGETLDELLSRDSTETEESTEDSNRVF